MYKSLEIPPWFVIITKEKPWFRHLVSACSSPSLNEKYLRGLKFHYVENISEVLKIAITNRKAVSTKYN